MAKYHGKYQRKPRPRPFLWLGIGCGVLALVCAGFIADFLYGAVKADRSRRQAIEHYVTPAASEYETTVPETTRSEPTAAPEAETTRPAPETTQPTEPPRFPTIDFAGLREKNPDVVA